MDIPAPTSHPVRRDSKTLPACCVIFIGSIAASILFKVSFFAAAGAPFLIIAWVVDRQIENEYTRDIEAYRQNNASMHGSIFEDTPPTGIEELPGQELVLYDCITLSRLGFAQKSDIVAILRTYEHSPELLPSGDNDIPFTSTDLEFLSEAKPARLSKEFLESVSQMLHTDPKIDLILRWIPSNGLG